MEFFPEKIHCLGIGGVGMSGVAAILASRGHSITGCDKKISPKTASWLRANAVEFCIGHSAAHIDGNVGLVIRTAAVEDTNCEVAMAAKCGIPVMFRGEALAHVASGERTFAVAGTHGKTTTSTFLAKMFSSLGFSPGWCIGGSSLSLGANARSPENGAPFVIEADESDGTLALYDASVAVITAIDCDHLDHFGSLEKIEECFGVFASRAKDAVVYCHDDARCRKIVSGKGAIGYGFGGECRLRIASPVLGAEGSSFDLYFDGVFLGRASIAVPGRHNILNSVAAFGALLAAGISPAAAFGAFKSVDGLPHRRYEISHTSGGCEIVLDYSHHPAEIRALVETALLRPHGKITAVFQPHRYTRTRDLSEQFAKSFAGIDGLVLLPVYAASESPVKGGTHYDLYRKMRSAGMDDPSLPVPVLADSIEDVASFFASPGGRPQRGDVILVVGAGDVAGLAGMLAQMPKTDVSPPFAKPKTTFGFEVYADRYLEAASIGQVRELLPLGNVRVLGGGSNLLAREFGVRGTVVKLKNDSFERIGENMARVGCGMPGARLLSILAQEGLSGLEFMAGIPGTVGGWLRMNAGTRHGAISDCLCSVTALGLDDGKEYVLDRESCGFSYRECSSLRDKLAFSAIFSFRIAPRDEIEQSMKRAREMRTDFASLATAGSFFKNPPSGESAGAILDKCGCKGMRVGGAFVAHRHANIISAGEGATPSDVIALADLMHAAALEKFGIDLAREVEIW